MIRFLRAFSWLRWRLMANSLRGEALRDEVHTEILRAARLEHLATERSPSGEDQAG